jgi:serine/threonine-protein kinase
VVWSPDGRWLVLRTDNGATGAGDLVGIRVGGDPTPVPLVTSPFTELSPTFSPDGRWLAYSSNESGRNEIYVRPFPTTEAGRWQVSSGGGAEPRWSANGKEIFFLDPAAGMMAVPVQTAPAFTAGEPHRLFDASFALDLGFHQSYDVTPDGREFLLVAPRRTGSRDRPTTLVLADNWFADMRTRLHQ